MSKGQLIVIDALDGSGKETQTKLLTEALYNRGLEPLLLSFPNYESPSSYGVKQYLQEKIKCENEMQSSIMYSYDRLMTFLTPDESGISPMEFYDNGGLIICDRYTTSNMIHQTRNLKSVYDLYVYLDYLKELEYKKLFLPKPDKVIFMDVKPKVALANIISRNKDRDKLENLKELELSYKNIDCIISHEEWERIICSTDEKMLPIEEIHNNILNIVDDVIGG